MTTSTHDVEAVCPAGPNDKMPSEYRYVLPDLASRFAAVVDFVCPLGRGLFSGPEPLAALQKNAQVDARYTVKEAISEITAGSRVGDNGEAFSGRDAQTETTRQHVNI